MGFSGAAAVWIGVRKFSHASVLMETHVMFDRSFFALLLPEHVTCFERKMCSVLNRFPTG